MATAFQEDGRRGAARRAVAGEAPEWHGEAEEAAHEDAAARHRELAGQGTGARGPRALERTQSEGRRATRARGRARRFDARALLHLDARASESPARSGGAPPGTRDARPRRRPDA